MIFKCEACDSWMGGDGSVRCVTCTEYKYVGREKSRLVVEYYDNPFEEIAAPEDWESLYNHSRKQNIWDLINQLEWREATMLTQYYFLEMTQDDIAEYHNMPRTTARDIISRAIEKIRAL